MNHNKPDIVITMPGERKSQLIDIPQYQNNVSKENEKGNKNIDLK